MFYLNRHLVPIRDKLYKFGWVWPDLSSLSHTSDKLLNLLSDQTVHKNGVAGSDSKFSYGIAQLDIDDMNRFDCANYHRPDSKNGLESLSKFYWDVFCLVGWKSLR